MFRFLCAAVILTGVLPAALLGSDSPKEYDGATERDELEGTWRFVKVEYSGQTFPDSEQGMIFHKGEFTWTGPGPKPAWIDQTTTNLPGGNRTLKGIYRIDGDGLKIACRLATNERPLGFDAKDGNGVTVWTFKRVK
jgi:uncharacterized protein (TIGR03067 family)